ncbi:hypothetical protein DL93DRAFT_1433358 [Clavulina sp. PMI_390]|nr:hypothetical protein DL93DRAFT_1433358 [Clavulina sp. PMI_390]
MVLLVDSIVPLAHAIPLLEHSPCMTVSIVSTLQTNVFVSTGVWLVCEILSSILFGILTVQCFFYFDRFRRDKWVLKSLVVLSWALELSNQVVAAWWSYEVQVRNFIERAVVTNCVWAPGAMCAITSINAAILQLYFARRGYLLNASLWPLSLIAVALALLAFISGLIVSGNMMSMLGDFPEVRWLNKLWVLTEAVTDLLVAGIVVYSLSGRRKVAYTSNRSGVERLMIYTISNGLLTSFLALLVFVLVEFLPHLGAYPGVTLVLARVYANSLLASLNLRGTWITDKKDTSSDHELTSRTDPSQGNPSMNRSINEADDVSAS